MIIQQNPERPNLAVTVDENNPALGLSQKVGPSSLLARVSA